MTARACLPEPPCDWRMVTSCPVFSFQYRANCWLKSSYSSRVGSYDTLSRVTGLPPPWATAGAAPMLRARSMIDPETASRLRMVVCVPLKESRSGSERVLEPSHEEVLGLAVAIRGAAVERGVLVVDRDLDLLVQVPVQADARALFLGDRARRTGEGGECVVVHVELAVARDQLQGAEALLARVEDLLGRGAAEPGLFPGEEERAARLPSRVGELCGGGAEPDFLAGDRIFALDAERTAVEVALRHQPAPPAVGEHRIERHRHVGPVPEDRLLAGRAVRGQPRAQCGPAQPALLGAGGSGDPDTQALERALGDRLEEYAGVQVLGIVQVAVAVAQVGYAVEDPDCVAQDATVDVTAQLEANVPVGNQVGRKAALGEDDVGGRLQPLQADRRLELAQANREGGREVDVTVGVEEHRLALGEVGHDSEAEVLPDRGLEDRTSATEEEGVGNGLGVVATEKPAVRLGVATELENILAIGRLDAETVLAARRHRGFVLGRGGDAVGLELAQPLEHKNLLLELVHPGGQRHAVRGGPLLLRHDPRSDRSRPRDDDEPTDPMPDRAHAMFSCTPQQVIDVRWSGRSGKRGLKGLAANTSRSMAIVRRRVVRARTGPSPAVPAALPDPRE